MPSVKMNVATLAIDKNTKNPYVLLKDDAERYALPIFIGVVEANAIAMELEKMTLPRPMTHDLLAEVIRRMAGRLDRVEVTEIKNNTYFALLFIEFGDDTLEIDARPSDSIALALRLDAPVYVREQVLLDAGAEEKGTAEREEYEKNKWKEFLENLTEDDFGKYKM